MLIFRFPNAPIISVLIAVTSLVPVVGAFAGVSVGFLLIVITDPIKALLFVVFILILQQIEGNLIYPRVVGKAVGLPAVIVISAVLVGGNVGGILGALLGVPLSALAYTLVKEAIDKPKLKPKKKNKA
jgi:predicted PurR-regulated permease PerM